MNTKTEDMRIIARNVICVNPQNPRADLGDLSELKASIQAHGVIQPILVRPVEGGYMVVAGSRRLAAATALELKEIPCHVRELDDDQAHELALMENIIRKDMTLIDEIRAVETLAMTGESHTEIAARFGRTARWVATRKKIAAMPEIVLKKIADGTLSIADAEMLCKIGDGNAIAEIVEESDDIAESVNRRLRELSDAPWVNGKSECAKCLLRSDKQASLFDDGGQARCMDEKCWEQKRNAWKVKKEAELRAAGHLPKESYHSYWQIENAYSGYLLEGRDDETIAELVEAGVKPRFHITEENEILLRYYYHDLPEKTVKTASGDDDVEVEMEEDDPEGKDDRQPSNGVYETYNTEEADEPDEDEEPAQPSQYQLRREANKKAQAIREIAFERINVQDVQWYRLLPFIAEVIRMNCTTPLDDLQDNINDRRRAQELPVINGLGLAASSDVEDRLLAAIFGETNTAEEIKALVKACGMDWDELEKAAEAEAMEA